MYNLQKTLCNIQCSNDWKRLQYWYIYLFKCKIISTVFDMVPEKRLLQISLQIHRRPSQLPQIAWFCPRRFQQ